VSLLDRFAYVQELKRQLARRDLDIIELRADVKKLVDCIATTKGVLAPFASRNTIPEDWGVVRRTSMAREIAELEAKHDTKGNEED
jgi:hypothetical protein